VDFLRLMTCKTEQPVAPGTILETSVNKDPQRPVLRVAVDKVGDVLIAVLPLGLSIVPSRRRRLIFRIASMERVTVPKITSSS
jgi:hypothetical protein